MTPDVRRTLPEDDVLQGLFAVGLQLRRLQQHLESPSAAEILEHAQADVTAAIHVVRSAPHPATNGHRT